MRANLGRALVTVALVSAINPPPAAGETHCWPDTISYRVNKAGTRVIEQHAVYRGCDHSARRHGAGTFGTPAAFDAIR